MRERPTKNVYRNNMNVMLNQINVTGQFNFTRLRQANEKAI